MLVLYCYQLYKSFMTHQCIWVWVKGFWTQLQNIGFNQCSENKVSDFALRYLIRVLLIYNFTTGICKWCADLVKYEWYPLGFLLNKHPEGCGSLSRCKNNPLSFQSHKCWYFQFCFLYRKSELFLLHACTSILMTFFWSMASRSSLVL